MLKSQKLRTGVTLIELIIAVTVLGVAIAGIITAFNVGLRTSMQASDLTLASIEAQLQMESLMGRPWAGALADFPLNSVGIVHTVGRGNSFLADGTPSITNGYHGWGPVAAPATARFQSVNTPEFWVEFRFEPTRAADRHSHTNMGLTRMDGSAFPAGEQVACTHPTVCVGACPQSELMLIRATVLLYLDATTPDYFFRHSTILNVHPTGRII